MKQRTSYFITLFLFALILTVNLTKSFFNIHHLEDMLFQIITPINGVGGDYVYIIFKYIIIWTLLFAALLYFLNKKYKINTKYFNIVLLLILLHLANFKGFITYNFKNTNFYEENYVDPKEINISFEEKRNLIHIVVESLEMSHLSKEYGGYRDISLFPNIEKLIDESDYYGGYFQTAFTDFTSGGIIAMTSGVNINGSLLQTFYGRRNNNLKGIHSLGEILNENGYTNHFMIGSPKEFGGRDIYFSNHGNYNIFDFKSAIDNNLVDKDYDNGWWGIEDKKLYEYSINKLKDIKEPFNLTLLTVDTHPAEGYLDSSCENNKELSKYENVHICSDKLLYSYINELKKIKLYENTTIIITGDHLNQVMHKDIPNNYDRKVLTIILNSNKEIKQDRISTTFDIFPTIVTSIGGNIEGDRLGLGTNLYSNKKTLAEKTNLDYINKNLRLNDKYYNKYIYKGVKNGS